MFLATVSIVMLLLLILCGGAALNRGVFRCGKEGIGLTRKVFSTFFAYGLSTVFWLGCYSYSQLGW